ncbi:hypothetical protein GCM10027187_29100 [Streptosporangium sandarakinum]
MNILFNRDLAGDPDYVRCARREYIAGRFEAPVAPVGVDAWVRELAISGLGPFGAAPSA